MNLKRTKTTFRTPSTYRERKSFELSVHAGFGRLLTAIARAIERVFGILYIDTIRACDDLEVAKQWHSYRPLKSY